MTERCETCKWWAPRWSHEDNMASGSGACELTRNLATGMKAHRGTKAIAEYDGEDFHESWLETRHDFGCVQWEPKDDSQ